MTKDHQITRDVAHHLASQHISLRHWPGAFAAFELALSKVEQLSDTDGLAALKSGAIVALYAGQDEQSEHWLKILHSRQTEILGPRHQNTVISAWDLKEFQKGLRARKYAKQVFSQTPNLKTHRAWLQASIESRAILEAREAWQSLANRESRLSPQTLLARSWIEYLEHDLEKSATTLREAYLNHMSSLPAYDPLLVALHTRLTEILLEMGQPLEFLDDHRWSEVDSLSLVARGSAWRYRDIDGQWKSGEGPLGYGEPDLATQISFGEDPTNKPLSVTFKTSFELPDGAAGISKLRLRVRRDDGVVVRINGKLVLMDHLTFPGSPSGPALHTAAGAAERHYFTYPIDPGLLRGGINEISAAVHQVNSHSSDLVFDLALEGLRRG